jgi:hypothetical protein
LGYKRESDIREGDIMDVRVHNMELLTNFQNWGACHSSTNRTQKAWKFDRALLMQVPSTLLHVECDKVNVIQFMY